MNALKDIIQHCHKRHGETLRQRKTVATPALHKRSPYHFKVHCARRTAMALEDIEQADISFMPRMSTIEACIGGMGCELAGECLRKLC